LRLNALLEMGAETQLLKEVEALPSGSGSSTRQRQRFAVGTSTRRLLCAFGTSHDNFDIHNASYGGAAMHS